MAAPSVSSLKFLMSHCGICCSSNIPCSKCEIHHLKTENHKLNLQLQFYKKSPCELFLNLPDVDKHFKLSSFFLPFNDSSFYDSNKFKFVTLTFDPSKFGLYNPDYLEKQYILNILYNLKQSKFLYSSLIGCFEYQKNGAIHAHIILKTSFTTTELDDLLRPYFTDIPLKKRQYAVKSEIIRNFDNVEKYLQKESDSFFRDDSFKSSKSDISSKETVSKDIVDAQPSPLLRRYNKLQSLIKHYTKEITDLKTTCYKLEPMINNMKIVE